MGLFDFFFGNKIVSLNSDEWSYQFNNDENALIIDVRTPSECKQGIIKGAKNLNLLDSGEFHNEIKKLDKSKNYYVYCRGGTRSKKACSIMKKMGIKNTYNLEGGISSYKSKLS